MRLRHGGSTGACRTTIRGRYGATVLSSMYRGCCCCDLVDESRPTTSGGGCGNQGYTVLYQYTFTAACSRALSLSLSGPWSGHLGAWAWRACERRACVLRAPCALRVRVMRGLLIEQREGGRHTCHESSPSNPKHAYFTVFLKLVLETSPKLSPTTTQGRPHGGPARATAPRAAFAVTFGCRG